MKSFLSTMLMVGLMSVQSSAKIGLNTYDYYINVSNFLDTGTSLKNNNERLFRENSTWNILSYIRNNEKKSNEASINVDDSNELNRIAIAEDVTRESAVVIPDKYLEKELRKAIGKPSGDIYPSELENLKSFSPSSCFIKSFEGIQYASNLESFVFNGGCNMNKVSNISPLATLTKLTNLELRSHDIVDISPLQDLTNLTNLELSFNKISDISPLKKLTNLENLNLNRNDITGVSLLQNLTKLTNLEVKDNYIDIAPGSSDRLIIDAILGRGATVNYSTQNHIEDGFADKFKLTQGKVAPPILEKCIQNSNGGVEFMFTCSKSGFTIYYR